MQYNSKIDYLMCKWLVPPRKNHKEFRLRDVFYGRTNPQTKDEIRIVSLKFAFDYLNNGKIDEAVAILKPHVLVNESEAHRMMKDTDGICVNFDLFAHILSDYQVHLAYSILYYNSLRVKQKLCPIIFRKDQIERIKKYLGNKNFETAFELYRLCLDNSEKHLISKRPYFLDEISAIIKSHQDKLKNQKVTAVYIFGSYARDEASEFSDLDIVITTSVAEINNDYLFALQSFLEDLLKIPLDLHIFQNKIDYSSFDKKMLTDMVKIL